jgi:hypothetical protein
MSFFLPNAASISVVPSLERPSFVESLCCRSYFWSSETFAVIFVLDPKAPYATIVVLGPERPSLATITCGPERQIFHGSFFWFT